LPNLIGVAPYELADGSIINQMLFSASVVWGTTARAASVNVADSDTPLLGSGLLHGFSITIDFAQKVFIIKEPDTDEPQPSGKKSKKK
jgi:predicted aspartyl protease